jgi:hypothetical protein
VEEDMKTRLVAIAMVLLSVACGGDDGGNNPEDCDDIRGTWGVTGQCGADLCNITQNGCSIDLDCNAANSYSGSIDGSDVMFSGTANGVDGDCTGSVSGTTMSGTCDTEFGPCDFSAVKQ